MFASVIVPIYNDEEYIGKLLDSLVNQTTKNFEVIIIDDESEDGTLDVVKKFKNKLELRILSSGKHNQSYSRNLGIKAAKGDILINLDSDCSVNKNFVQGIINSFKSQNIDGLRVKEQYAFDYLIERLDYLRSMEKFGGFIQTTRIFKKGYLYDDDLVCFGDDFVMDKKLKGNVGFCNESVIYAHRFHSWSEVFNSWKRYPSGFVYYRKYDNILKGFIPLFFPFISPFVALHRLIKYRDPVAFLIPIYDIVRTFAYLYGMVSNPRQMIEGYKKN